MALPILGLYLCSSATLADVGGFLGADLSQAGRFEKDHFRVRQPLGQLHLSYSFQTGLDFGDYAHEWNLIPTLDIPKESGWAAIRTLVALELCGALHEQYGGVYLGVYDTGAVAFYFKDAVLWLPEEDKEYYQRFPLFYDHIAYKQLEPV